MGAGIGWRRFVDWSRRMYRLSERVFFYKDLGGIVDLTRPGDDVLIMSNGGFGGLHDRLLQALVDSGIGGSA